MTIIQLTFVEVFREFRTKNQRVLKDITSHDWRITCSQLPDLLGTFAYSLLNCMSSKHIVFVFMHYMLHSYSTQTTHTAESLRR